MKDKSKTIHNRKAFLNKNGFHSDANILTKIVTCEREGSSSVYADVTIKDCHYKVSLSVDIYTKKDYDNTIYKIRKLISELELFKENVEYAREWYIEAEERVKERTKIAKNDKRKKPHTGGDPSSRIAIPGGILNRRRGTQ